ITSLARTNPTACFFIAAGTSACWARTEAMHVNYRYLIEFIAANAKDGPALDYGCGRGEVVEEGRAAGLDLRGTDLFHADGEARDVAARRGLLGDAIREMRGNTIPFADETFQVVVSNQVLEHVSDLDATASEIARTLRAGGVFFSLFAPRESWREGH